MDYGLFIDTDFGLGEVLVPALPHALLAFLVCRLCIPSPVALGLVVVRFLIPVVYFALVFDGTTILDDSFGYFDGGKALKDAGHDPLTILFTEDGWHALRSVAGGSHVVYYWYNYATQYLFGSYWFVPVFGNTLLSFVTAHSLFRIVLSLGFSRRYAQGTFVFFLLHPDVIVWTSIYNLKDPVVLTLAALAFRFLLEFQQTGRPGYALLTLAPLYVLLYLRFYIPVLIVAAVVVAVAVTLMSRFASMVPLAKPREVYLAALTAAVAVPAAVVLAPGVFDTSGYDLLSTSPVRTAFGSIRFLLTPMPWSVHPAYRALILPAMFNILLFLPFLGGVLLLWSRYPQSRVLLVYLCVVTLFYASVPELQGPRHRFQLAFILAFCQSHFLWTAVLRPAIGWPGGGARRPPPDPKRPHRFPSLPRRGPSLRRWARSDRERRVLPPPRPLDPTSDVR